MSIQATTTTTAVSREREAGCQTRIVRALVKIACAYVPDGDREDPKDVHSKQSVVVHDLIQRWIGALVCIHTHPPQKKTDEKQNKLKDHADYIELS